METIFIFTLVISVMLLSFVALKISEVILNKVLERVDDRERD